MNWLTRVTEFGRARYTEGFWSGIPFGAAMTLALFLAVMTTSHWWYSL